MKKNNKERFQQRQSSADTPKNYEIQPESARQANQYQYRRHPGSDNKDVPDVPPQAQAPPRPSSLQFTDEERTDPELTKYLQRSEKVAEELEADQTKIPKKKVLQKKRTFDEAKANAKVRLRFEETDKPKLPSKLQHSPLALPARELMAQAHRQIHQAEKDNVGVETAHKSEEAAETAAGAGIRKALSAHRMQKLKTYRTAAKLEKKADKASINALYQKALRDNPTLTSNPLSRWQQKQAIKRQYAAVKAGKGATSTQKTAMNAQKAAKKTAEATRKTVIFIARHWKGFLIALAAALLVVLLLNAVSSCSVMLQGVLKAIIGTSYTAEDEDILATETYYISLESGLRQEIETIENTYPGYDEYRYSLSEIGHNPFELISYLTALYEDFTFAEVRLALDALFDRQYSLTVMEEIEVRYRTETHTGSYTTIDPETGESETHYYTYEVEVPYNYYILNVTLVNRSLSGIAAGDLNSEQLELYAVYMETFGNKPYLFEGNIYAYVGEYTDYDIPPEALADATFAALIAEAKKYLGYPYVWGGSTPATSFDCSGFVCWVLNNSGIYSIGRTNVRGILSQCAIIPPSEARPGDIIFFSGTYDTHSPVSHVGIYVGNGMMIHCGNPIQYVSVNTPYWSEHFYAYGRLNY